MDVKKWTALLTSVRCGSFSKAAEELGYTQSGLSYLINSLEEECQMSLLMRSWSGVKLSREGEALLDDITALVSADAQLTQHLGELGAQQRGHICIGTYASISVHWLSRILPRFRTEFPKTEIELRIASRDGLTQLLESDTIDLAFSDRLELPGVTWTELYADPLLALLPKDHPAARNKVFAPEDAGGLSVLLPPDSSTGSNPLRLSFAKKANVRVRSEDDTVLFSLVRQGVGFCIMAELIVRGRADDLTVLPLNEPLYRRLGVNRKTDLHASPALRRLIALMSADPPVQPARTQISDSAAK